MIWMSCDGQVTASESQFIEHNQVDLNDFFHSTIKAPAITHEDYLKWLVSIGVLSLTEDKKDK